MVYVVKITPGIGRPYVDHRLTTLDRQRAEANARTARSFCVRGGVRSVKVLAVPVAR